MVLIYLKSPNIGLLSCSTSTEVHHSLIKVTTSKLEKVRKQFPWSAYSMVMKALQKILQMEENSVDFLLWHEWLSNKKAKVFIKSIRSCLRFNRPLWYWLISLLKSVQSEKSYWENVVYIHTKMLYF